MVSVGPVSSTVHFFVAFSAFGSVGSVTITQYPVGPRHPVTLFGGQESRLKCVVLSNSLPHWYHSVHRCCLVSA